MNQIKKFIGKYRTMISLICILAFIILVLVPLRFTMLIIHNPFKHETNQYSNPKILNKLEYEDIQFKTKDNLNITGWLVKSEQNRATVILCHGFFASMDDMLDCMPFLHKAGYNTLTFDFRNHARSEGKQTTLGYHELKDLEATIDFTLSREDLSDKIIVWGKSMGAAISLVETSRNDNIKTVIAESSYLTFRETLAHHGKLMYKLPAFPLVDLTIIWMRIRTGMKPEVLNVLKAVKKFDGKQAFFIGSEQDERMPPYIAKKLHENAPCSIKELWITQVGQHGSVFDMNRSEYEKKVLKFLEDCGY